MTTFTTSQIASFAMHVLFASEATPREHALAKRIFSSDALVMFVPRSRPLVATSMGVDQLLRQGRQLPIATGVWTETWHTEEPDSRNAECTRVSCGVEVMVPNTSNGTTVDVLFVVAKSGQGEQIVSCCMVYDEPPRDVPSPITLNMSAVSDAMVELTRNAEMLLTG